MTLKLLRGNQSGAGVGGGEGGRGLGSEGTASFISILLAASKLTFFLIIFFYLLSVSQRPVVSANFIGVGCVPSRFCALRPLGCPPKRSTGQFFRLSFCFCIFFPASLPVPGSLGVFFVSAFGHTRANTRALAPFSGARCSIRVIKSFRAFAIVPALSNSSKRAKFSEGDATSSRWIASLARAKVSPLIY